MVETTLEKTVARLLYLGVPAISLFVWTNSITDPVNVTKFLFLGAVGTAALLLYLLRGFQTGLQTSRAAVLLIGLFVLCSTMSVITSQSPLVQNLYGVYGRNTGYLTYIFLTGIFLSSLLLRNTDFFKKIFFALFATGLVNIIYCGWVISFGDFIGWNNPYGNILGLFGNPNFIGAFLGMWISATAGFFISYKLEAWKRILIALVLLLAVYEVYKSHAVQGVVVSAAGLAVVLFFYIRSRFTSWLPVTAYSSAVIAIGIVALAGALQKGPLAQYIYKRSVSLRGSYWNAGLETGLQHPFTGVGMDAYGDWYRRSRSENAATLMPGPSTVTNSAHNVVLDIFSYGGFPLLISYLGLITLGAVAIIKGIRRTKSYDPIFVSLSVAWIGYQLQSLISINQIGLAVWGWLLTGVLISYEFTQQQKQKLELQTNQDERKRSVRSLLVKSETVSNPLIAGIGLVLGLILAVPPLSADMSWAKATTSGNFIEVQKALTPDYLHPQSSERLVNVIGILENSQLFDQAREYALIATRFNPGNFDAWFALYSIKNTTEEERKLALEKMKLLDPQNPEVTKR
jgi:O-antigen ligase